MDDAPVPWSAQKAREALAAAGLDRHAELVRMGSAAAFRSGELFIRVAAPEFPAAASQRCLDLASYLAEHGILCPLPVEQLAIPTPAGTITLWQWEDERPEPQDIPEAAGALLAELHRLPAPSWLEPFDPLASARDRMRTIREHSLASEDELKLLERGLAAAETSWREISADRAQSRIVHGDFTFSNTLRCGRGLLLIDFEYAGTGSPLWDVAKMGTNWRRFRRDPQVWRRFTLAYTRAGGPALVGEIERIAPATAFLGAVWTTWGRPTAAHFEPESHVRLASLLDDSRNDWQPF